MEYLAVIPARYASSRFPGKPLALLAGKPVIEHVYLRAAQALGPDNVLVATDDERIARAVEAFGGRAAMTSADCANGTERCRQAYAECGRRADVVVNVQGDEPMVRPEQILVLAKAMEGGADIGTLVRRPAPGEDVADPNLVKVVTALDGSALYFSRAPIPCFRDGGGAGADYLVHVGMYAFRAPALLRVADLPATPLEKAEKLEQLRWLQHGLRIATALTDARTVGIDTPADLEAARRMMSEA